MGGYTAVPWTPISGYRSDTTAFLFTLVNPSNTPLKLPVISTSYATYHYSALSTYGPIFGGGRDLLIYANCDQNSDSYSYIHSYTSPAGSTGYSGGAWMLGSSHFQCKDIEVFRVDE